MKIEIKARTKDKESPVVVAVVAPGKKPREEVTLFAHPGLEILKRFKKTSIFFGFLEGEWFIFNGEKDRETFSFDAFGYYRVSEEGVVERIKYGDKDEKVPMDTVDIAAYLTDYGLEDKKEIKVILFGVRTLEDACIEGSQFPSIVPEREKPKEERHVKRSKADHLYLITNTTTKEVKIGRSKNPESRLKSLQTGSPSKLKLTKVYKGEGNSERELHKKLAYLRLKGEWFKPLAKEKLEEHFKSN